MDVSSIFVQILILLFYIFNLTSLCVRVLLFEHLYIVLTSKCHAVLLTVSLTNTLVYLYFCYQQKYELISATLVICPYYRNIPFVICLFNFYPHSETCLFSTSVIIILFKRNVAFSYKYVITFWYFTNICIQCLSDLFKRNATILSKYVITFWVFQKYFCGILMLYDLYLNIISQPYTNVLTV